MIQLKSLKTWRHMQFRTQFKDLTTSQFQTVDQKFKKKITQTNSGSFNKSVASAPLPQKNH